VRDSILAALIPGGFGILVVALLFLPKNLLGSFDIWILLELYLGLAFLDGYYLARKYKIRRRILVYFGALIGVILVILSYVPYEVQILSYIVTASVSLIMYVRIAVEFRRRKYT
jgi:hypothetical protein